MMTWLDEHWYHLTGIGGSLAIFAFYIYARQDHDGASMSLWRRLHYTLASGIAVSMVLMLAAALSDVVAPQLEIFPFFLSQRVYWLLVPLYIAAWFAAPYLSERYPISPFERR